MPIEIDKLVPDTSMLIEGIVSEKIKKKEIKVKEIIIHEAVIAELEHQANINKAIGFLGLDEIKRLKDIGTDFTMRFAGVRPKPSEIRYASLGEIDAMIRQLAWVEDATLITSDKVQSKVAESKGMKIIYIKPTSEIRKLKLDDFFDETTMSVHLRQDVLPYAKKGVPGSWSFDAIRETILKEEELQDISREIIEEAKLRRDSFIEIERAGSTIVQLGIYRIVITKPPFSDGWEITAVKPVRRLDLGDYKLTEKLMKRVSELAEGILVAGSPGMGKSTFAQALAEYYAGKGRIVKTVEAPRDLILSNNITQYAISHADPQEIHDILLLTRPDYTIFDEMRNTKDFELFADLRLAGVGMVGVVHATSPIDAIQRFIGRVEMGVIPQVIDTVVFIKNGYINKVLALKMTVKVPSGMTEADLSRPVVVVTDFESNKLEYEIYSYGEQTVVVPVDIKTPKSGVTKLAQDSIKKEFDNYSDNVNVEIISDGKCIVSVPESAIAKIIGKQGTNIDRLEEKLGMRIDVQALSQKRKSSETKELQYTVDVKNKNLIFDLGSRLQNAEIQIYVDDDFILTAKAGSNGQINIKKNNHIGKLLSEAITNRKTVRILGNG
ncbi:MAG: PINc/VapC family ATPase [Nanoarchaeota archaeon]